MIGSRRARSEVMENSESRRSMADFLFERKKRVSRGGATGTYVHVLPLATRLTPSLCTAMYHFTAYFSYIYYIYSLWAWKWSGRRFLTSQALPPMVCFESVHFHGILVLYCMQEQAKRHVIISPFITNYSMCTNRLMFALSDDDDEMIHSSNWL